MKLSLEKLNFFSDSARQFLASSRRRFPVWMQGWGQSETGPLTFRFFTRRALAGRVGLEKGPGHTRAAGGWTG